MSKPWSVTELEEMIPDIVARLDDAVTDLKRLGQESATKTHGYKLARARAMLNAIADGASNQDARDATVTVAVDEQMLAAQIAENSYADQRHVINVLRTQADLCRTMMVSRRESPG